MLRAPIKIVHTADIQIEVTGVHQRHDEFEYILREIEDVIKYEKPLIYAITGDIFEKCNPNDIERQLFIEHLMRVRMISTEIYIIITPGNHDTNQRKSANFYLTSGEIEPVPNALEPIVTALDDDRILLLDRSTAYPIIPNELLIWNWSQKTKHSECINEEYNPALNVSPTAFPGNPTCITFYHDPIAGCKMFDDKEIRGAEKSGTLDAFNTLSILAGDIHKPQIIQKANKTFIYCGSPVPRNFGEGDYYKDGQIYQHGMENHAVNVVDLNPDGTLSNQKFVKIRQYRSYSTFEVSPGFPFDALNFKLESPKRENFIRVKLPAATETYLALEESIINAIRTDNSTLEHINISFQYGKAITVDDTDIKSESDIHQLISEEQISRVAVDYIEKQVNASRSIPTEDKEKCITFIKNLFSRELKNYISNVPSNNIELISVDISNFMAFGEKVSLDLLKVNNLIKLTGGNGVGKTTFYNVLKWVITGYISNSQNRTKKNENNILVFNDYRWDVDDMGVRLRVYINGIEYAIIRTVHRDWKKNVTPEQKQSKNWRSFISGTTSSIKIESAAFDTPKKDDEAESFLESIFGGLGNLNSIVFPSQFTLRSVVNADPAKLCEDILRNIGMSFFDKMYEKYDSVRSDIMSKLAKPDKTVDQLIQLITTEIESNKSLHDELDDILSSKKDAETYMDLTASGLLEQKQKLNPDGTQSKLDSLKLEELEVNNKIESETADYEKKKLGLETYINNINIDVGKKFLKDTDYELETLNSETSKVSADILSLTQSNSELKTQIHTEENAIRSTLDVEIAKLQGDKESLYKENESLNEQKSELKVKYQNLLNQCMNLFTTKINTVSQSLAEHQSDLSKHLSDIKELDVRIDELQNSKVCPTCGRELSEEHLSHIQEKIDELQEKINSHISNKNELDAEITELKKKKLELEKKYQEFMDNYNSVEAIANLDKAITDYETRIAEVIDKIQDVSRAIEKLKGSLLTRLNESPTITNLNQKLESNASKLSKFDKKKKELEQKIQDTTKNRKDIQELIDGYESYTKELSELTASWGIRSVELNNEMQRIKTEIERVTDLLEHNKQINQRIAELEQQQETCSKVLENIKSREISTTTKIGISDNKITELQNLKNSAIKYRIVDASLKQYKALIGKTGLPQHIFSIIRGVLNSKLNDLLEGMDFRLLFDESNNLIMVDLSKPGHPVRRPSQLSGMQTCFTGLALIYVNRMCNNTFIFDSLFIDEVSGQLNSGAELTYESQNYQEQLKKLLKKFTNLKIWIVDHVIEDLNEDFRFEVVPSNSGASIIRR